MVGPSQRGNAALLELARWLCDDAALTEEITLAIDRPGDYVDRFADRLRYRGISKARFDAARLPVIALVDGLHARGLLDEIDWNSPGDETREAMRTIVADEDWEWLIADAWVDKHPHEVFGEIEARLAPKGLTLMVIEIGTDSYPLTALPIAKVAESRRLAGLAGYGRIVPPLVAAFGDDPRGASR